mgnify:FL=1
MYIKKLFLILITFLFTGCNVIYDVQIKDKKTEESLTIDSINVSIYNEELNRKRYSLYSQSNSSNPYEQTDDSYATYDIFRVGDNGLKYLYKYNSNYNDSNIANSCYEYFSVDTDENKVSILTGNSFKCFELINELDSVTININSNYKVIQSNADKIVGKKHTWYITRENASNKPIIFVYDKSKKNMTIMQYLIDNVPLVVVVGTTLMLGGITFLIINTKKKKANKI